jgi:hypothetical protein
LSRAHLATLASCAAYAAAVLVLAVGADRVVSARLFDRPGTFVPAYRSYTEFSTGQKIHQLRSLDSAQFDTLVIGDSLALYGVDPLVYDAAAGRAGAPARSYNAAIPSAAADFWPAFFDRWWRRPLPCTLLLGLQPRAVDVEGRREVTFASRFFFSSDGFAHRDMSDVTYGSEDAMSRLFRLWGRRGDLFRLSPADVAAGRRYRVQVVPISNGRGWARWGDQNDDPHFHVPATELARQAAAAPARRTRGLRLAPEADRAIRDLAARERARGGRLVVFTAPTLFDPEIYGSERMWTELRVAMTRMAGAVAGMDFVDARDELGPFAAADFGDGRHLNARGARRLSTGLGRLVARLGAPPTCGGPTGHR